MSKRDDVARAIYCYLEPFKDPDAPHVAGFAPDVVFQAWQQHEAVADAILALLAEPDDRMVEAATKEMMPDWDVIAPAAREPILRVAKAAIRAAMKAAGE